MTEQAEQLSETSVLLSLKVKSLGNRARVDSSEVETDADKKMLYVSKALWDSEELRVVRRVNNELKSWIRARSRPSYFRNGLYLVKVQFTQELEAYIESLRPKLDEAVEAFITAMPRLEQDSKERLGSMYKEEDYPTAGNVRRSFGWEYSWLAVDVPGSLRRVSEAFFQRAEQKAREQAEYAVGQIRETLRAETLATVNYLLAALEPGDDGKAKAFRAPVVKKVQEALDLMRYRETDDPELTAELDRIRGLMEGVDPVAVRKDAEFSQSLARGFESVRERLGTLVVERPTRRIDLSRERAAAVAEEGAPA